MEVASIVMKGTHVFACQVLDILYNFYVNLGFKGSNCEIRVDKSCNMDCQNGGVCYLGQHCYCPPAFEGEFCEKRKFDPCNHDYCGKNGLCSPMADYRLVI